MKERGIGAVVVIAIVVVIVAVIGVGAFLLLRGGLPIYPGSQRWEVPSALGGNIPSMVGYAAYNVTDASIQDVLNWYKNQMTDWTLENEKSVTSIGGGVERGVLLYKKGNDGALIIALSGTGITGTGYILATDLWSAFSGPVGLSTLAVTAKEDTSGYIYITITDNGGDPIACSDIMLVADNSPATKYSAGLTSMGASGTLMVGNSITQSGYPSSGIIAGSSTITVELINTSINEMIYGNHNVLVGTLIEVSATERISR